MSKEETFVFPRIVCEHLETDAINVCEHVCTVCACMWKSMHAGVKAAAHGLFAYVSLCCKKQHNKYKLAARDRGPALSAALSDVFLSVCLHLGDTK